MAAARLEVGCLILLQRPAGANFRPSASREQTRRRSYLTTFSLLRPPHLESTRNIGRFGMQLVNSSWASLVASEMNYIAARVLPWLTLL